MNQTAAEMSVDELEAEFAQELPGRDLMACLPVTITIGGTAIIVLICR